MQHRPHHFYLLDLVRGLASLAVVVWHYQNFFRPAPAVPMPVSERAIQPFYSILWPLYEHGTNAVYLFFVLSGFVFFFNYRDAISDGTVSAYKFAVLRFSRLYPLHFVTLLIVAAVEFWAQATTGAFLIGNHYDLRHFILNLGFASHWGLQWGHSFNGPIWSVSVEIICYAVFFVLAATIRKSIVYTMGMVLAGLALALSAKGTFLDIGWALYSFFAGGAAFAIYEHLHGKRAASVISATGLVAAIVLFLSVEISIGPRPDMVLNVPAKIVLFGACFPAAILFLALLQSAYLSAGRSVRIIGDVTYSVYLLHFPIQLATLGIAAHFGLSIDYTDPLAFTMYVGCVFLVSVPTFYLFERPVQTYLRRKLLAWRMPAVQV
jgi:peptidoglycan/LPS O-acetylase OafA/YrhL